MTDDFLLSSYHYHLPKELVAQTPCEKREESRLLVLNRASGDLHHLKFKEIVSLLNPKDCLVINRTKVFPARLIGRKPTGGKVELLLLELPRKLQNGLATARALCKSSKPLRPGSTISFKNLLQAEVKKRHNNGQVDLILSCNGQLLPTLEQVGVMPLPPYIKRNRTNTLDKERYQTVYAREIGSVAAPTAGLHFTNQILDAILQKGVKVAPVILHVGYGTFSPIRTQDIRKHKIHKEWITIDDKSASTIQKTKEAGGRIVAVGTTSVRTIEYVKKKKGKVCTYSGQCDLYIFPGFKFAVTDALITNFHLPGSSLLVLVSAFAGREKILSAYKEAIKKRYRFFSYGDAMLIL